MFGADKKTRITEDGRRRARAAQARVQRQHCALAEADECQPVIPKPVTRQFRVEKGVERRLDAD